MEWIASSCHRATWSICLIAENTENAIETCTVKNLLDPPNILWWITQLNVLAGRTASTVLFYCHSISTYFSFVFNRFMKKEKSERSGLLRKVHILMTLFILWTPRVQPDVFRFVCLWICEFVMRLSESDCFSATESVTHAVHMCVCVRWTKIWWYTAHIRFSYSL